jgi:transposase
MGRLKKNLIERAYSQLEIPVYTEDEAGPYQTVPYPAKSWQLEGEPARYPHEYIKQGTAKIMTLFEPKTGKVRVKGVVSCTNQVLHPWLKEQLEEMLAALPKPKQGLNQTENRALWESWQAGLTVVPSLGPVEKVMPPLRALLVIDNLAGHHTVSFVVWLFEHGIMPLFTPLGGSWLNMTESIQAILKQRGLDGSHPKTPQQIIKFLEETAEGWNKAPTPFVWGGKRQARRQRLREKGWQHRQRLGGSGACILRFIKKAPTPALPHRLPASQVAH